MPLKPSGIPATSRVAWDGSQMPIHSATTVAPVGTAPAMSTPKNTKKYSRPVGREHVAQAARQSGRSRPAFYDLLTRVQLDPATFRRG